MVDGRPFEAFYTSRLVFTLINAQNASQDRPSAIIGLMLTPESLGVYGF